MSRRDKWPQAPDAKVVLETSTMPHVDAYVKLVSVGHPRHGATGQVVETVEGYHPEVPYWRAKVKWHDTKQEEWVGIQE